MSEKYNDASPIKFATVIGYVSDIKHFSTFLQLNPGICIERICSALNRKSFHLDKSFAA